MNLVEEQRFYIDSTKSALPAKCRDVDVTVLIWGLD